jgi:hypothetical protein
VEEVIHAHYIFSRAERIQEVDLLDFVEALKAAMQSIARQPKIASVKKLYQHLTDVADVLAGHNRKSRQTLGNAQNYLKVTY